MKGVMMSETKEVTYLNLKPGQEIQGHSLEGCRNYYGATVKSINPAFVTVLMWNKYEEKIDARSMFIVEMTEQEFESKYYYKAQEVMHNIQNKLIHDEIGDHEMWNAWLYGTPYEIAKECIKEDMKIVGYCSDIMPKMGMFSDDVCDIGVCAEYNQTGEKIWCHWKYSSLLEMLEDYKNLLGG